MNTDHYCEPKLEDFLTTLGHHLVQPSHTLVQKQAYQSQQNGDLV